MTVLHTSRLRLEPVSIKHLDDVDAMDKIPEVMRYVGGEPATREQTTAWIAGVKRCWQAWGYSWWVFIEPSTDRVAGAGCIQHARREAELPSDLDTLRCNPLEIGWRLHPNFWGKGLATEAARCMAAFAFGDLSANELIAVRHPDNAPSARVMERLHMRYRGIETWYGHDGVTHVVSHKDWFKKNHTSAREA